MIRDRRRRLLEEALLAERQADAAIPADDRDFTSYIANVLFDDWNRVKDFRAGN